jgi:hypothetical protein
MGYSYSHFMVFLATKKSTLTYLNKKGTGRICNPEA